MTILQFTRLLLAALLTICALRGQEGGVVTGVVVSAWDGAALPAVVVTVRGTTMATQTDQSGRFEIKSVPPGDHVLRFSKSGFASATVTDVRVLLGQVTTVNGNLRPEFFEMEEYEVTAEEFTEQTEKILFERQQSGSMLEAIGSEQFSKLGAGDAGAIVGRVTGVSLVGGKFAVVRGLSDRYTRTLMNGLEVPSSDPYRTAPQLDLFPSAMIDRINVNKTFLPDQPGGSAGGTIDIVTKPFPDQAFLKFSYGQSFNPNSNLRDDFLADPKSNTGFFNAPDGPDELQEALWSIVGRPALPRNSPSNESQASAVQRRQQAEAYAGILQGLGTTDFGGVNRKSPLNTSLSASAGETKKVFDRDLGVFGGLNYSRNFKLLDEFEVARFSGNGAQTRGGTETRGNINTDFGANVNLGYRLSENHELGFNFMLVDSIDEEARHVQWTYSEGNPPGYQLEQWQLHYTGRQIQNYQLRGSHTFPNLADSQLDWSMSLANTSQDEPDHRFINYSVDENGQASLGVADIIPFYPSRYFREIKDESGNIRADWKFPLAGMKEESNLKFGFLNSSSDRNFREQYFTYQETSGFVGTDPNSYLSDPAYLDYLATRLGGRRTNYTFVRQIQSVNGNPYSASQRISAVYPMGDVGVTSWLRLVGGARLEQTSQDIQATTPVPVLDQTDLLPAVSAVFTFFTNLNLRLGYSETIARPSFRERAPIDNYLPDVDLFARGNPDLRISHATSYDARVEWYPGPGDIVSAGVFVKELVEPIELIYVSAPSDITWTNRATGRVMGVEFEARKDLEFIHHTKGLSMGVNVAIIESETTLTQSEFDYKVQGGYKGSITRPLYDQSPYIINLDMSYAHPTSGTAVTIGANFTGERIILSQVQGDEIYEHPPETLDLLISQKIGKNLTVRFGVKNILNPETKQTYGPDFEDNLRQSFKRGRTFSLSLGADF